MQKVLWRKNQGLSFVHAEFAMCIRLMEMLRAHLSRVQEGGLSGANKFKSWYTFTTGDCGTSVQTEQRKD